MTRTTISIYEKIPARLESRIEISDGLAIFRFALDRDFSFDPGQYATLWLTHEGKTLARPYTIASSSSEKRRLEFYVNLVKDGTLTPSFWESTVIEGLRRGDSGTRVAVMGPKGRFIMDPEDLRDLVFIASGTGLAPFISMIRKLNESYLDSPKTFARRRIYLVHGVSYPIHLGYREELEGLAAETLRDPGRKLSLFYLPTISRPFIDSSWTGLTGRAETLLEIPQKRRLGSQNLEEAVRILLGAIVQPATHAIYVCGHPGTVDRVVRILSRRGFHIDSDIKREKYYP